LHPVFEKKLMAVNRKVWITLPSLFILLLVVYIWATPPSCSVFNSRKTPVDTTLIRLKADFVPFEKKIAYDLDSCGSPGAAVVVIRDTAVVFMRGYGVKMAGGNDSVDIHTTFRLGSVSKGFAAVVSAMLVQEGHFSFDDKLTEYLPEFRLSSQEQTGRITIRNILSHTTGLSRHSFTNLVERGWSIDSIETQMSTLPLAGKEGELFAYQNAAYSLIEKVIKKTTGRDYREILTGQLFLKAGMADASCSFEGMTGRANKTSPHIAVSNTKFKEKPITEKYYNSVSSGGVNASISDMGIWLRLLLGHYPEVVKKEALSPIFEPVINTNNEWKVFNRWKSTEESWYAMGWRVIDYNNRRYIYHGGFVNDYRAEIAFDRETGIGICALFNAPCGLSNTIVRNFFDYYNQIRPLPAPGTMANESGKTQHHKRKKG
jgi:beta-lactamase class C